MNPTSSIIHEFKAVIHDVSEDEAFKFVKMAKGNLNLALNYYFNSQSKLAKKSEVHSSLQSKSAFSELMEGSKNQAKLEKIFNSLKQDYAKPVESTFPANFGEKERIEKVEGKRMKTLDLNVGRFQEVETAKKEERKVHLERTAEGKALQITREIFGKEGQETKEVKPYPSESLSEFRLVKKTSFPATKRPYSEIEKSQSSGEKAVFSERKNESLPSEKKPSDFPRLIGKALIKGYTLRSFNLSYLKKGDELFLKRERKILVDENKKKKKANLNGKSGLNDTIIRILTKTQEIGKLENQYSDILAPLLDENFIILEAFAVQIPPLVETFTPIILEIKVYLQANAITRPITRIIDKGKGNNELEPESQILSFFEKTKKSFLGLFEILALKKVTETVIKLPNKRSAEKLVESNFDSSIQTMNHKPASLNKLEFTNPYQKLPKQATLFAFANKEGGSNNIKGEEEKAANRPQSPNENNENGEIDYENLIKIETNSEDLECIDPPASFRSLLHPYQKQALFWMLAREKEPAPNEPKDHPSRPRNLHPLWEEYELEDHFRLYFNPYSGQISSEVPLANIDCKGGILADEMGLGKTVMMLSLIHANRPEVEVSSFHRKSNKASTLVIVPLTLLSQWEDEIQLHSRPKTLSHCLYYADNRPINLNDYDIVITTYGVVSSEYASAKKELFGYEWHRVVLDEAHYIKGRTIQIAKAVYHLNARNRWCMTGTPIQNKLDDLFSLIHFLRLEPWSDYLWWNSYINRPFEKKDPLVFQMVQSIISPILLRRTKKGRTKDGRSIVDLPEKETLIEWVSFGKEEECLYNEVYRKSKKEFDDLLSKGAFLSNYMHVFDILTRLRQICDHPYLMLTRSDYANKEKLEETLRKFVLKRLEDKKAKSNPESAYKDDGHFEILFDESSQQEVVVNLAKKNDHSFNEKYFGEVVSKLKGNEVESCVVCLGDLEDSVITICLHVTCRLCLIRSLETSGMCPLCRKILHKDDFMTVPRDNKFDIDLDSKFKRSSKLEALMQKIQKVLPSGEKTVIFSQFLGFFDLIEYDFKRNGIQYLRLDGSLNQKKRSEVLQRFKEDASIGIILISLKAGGVGLNLTEANHVFLLDPWWNPAVEEQAIERVHRIGQKRKVEVVRFITRGSIEERMVEMHKNKKELFNSAICGSENMKQERKMQNMEYFKYLMKHF